MDDFLCQFTREFWVWNLVVGDLSLGWRNQFAATRVAIWQQGMPPIPSFGTTGGILRTDDDERVCSAPIPKLSMGPSI